MDLKTLCMKNMVETIKNLPPILRDEVIGQTTKDIKKEAYENAKKHIMKEIRQSAAIVVEDVTDRIVMSHIKNQNWERPEYTKDIDDELYYTFVDISEKFVIKTFETTVFLHQEHNRRHLDDSYEQSSSDDDSYEY